MSRLRRFTLLAAATLSLAIMGTRVFDVLYPACPRFYRFLIMGMGIKLLGDLVYFTLWPGRREWTYFYIYLADDWFLLIRFVFPLSIVQRLAEVNFFPPALLQTHAGILLYHLVTGPYLAAAVYLINRWLQEEHTEETYRQARNFLHLP